MIVSQSPKTVTGEEGRVGAVRMIVSEGHV